MLLGNVNCLNLDKYKVSIYSCLICLLCEDVSDIILSYLELFYKKEYEELLRFRRKTYTLRLSLSVNNESFGFKFSGARNDKVGNKKMFGIFISDIKNNSAAADFMYLHKKDYRGFQVIEHEWLWGYGPRSYNLDLSRNGTLKKLKQYQNDYRTPGIKLKLKWNPKLLKTYNYNEDVSIEI